MDDVGNKGEIKAVLPRREREREKEAIVEMWKRVFLSSIFTLR